MRISKAMAHPIQGLIKYHGIREGLPYHGSISCCVSPLTTTTEVRAVEGENDMKLLIDGRAAGDDELERVKVVVDEARAITHDNSSLVIDSWSNFPVGVGLGSSSSAFASLALAIYDLFDLGDYGVRVSSLARLGAASSPRSLTGGFSELIITEDPYSIRLDEGLDMGILMILVNKVVDTRSVHRVVASSPLFRCRLEYVKNALAEMRSAIGRGDLKMVWELAERDTLNLHAITMDAGVICWAPQTLMAIERVKMVRGEGVDCYFSIDTGATTYVNCYPEDLDEVKKFFDGFEVLDGRVGGEAHLV
jgi:phosphomevalonate decarboxylase